MHTVSEDLDENVAVVGVEGVEGGFAEPLPGDQSLGFVPYQCEPPTLALLVAWDGMLDHVPGMLDYMCLRW